MRLARYILLTFFPVDTVRGNKTKQYGARFRGIPRAIYFAKCY